MALHLVKFIFLNAIFAINVFQKDYILRRIHANKLVWSVLKTAETDPSRIKPRPHNSCLERSRDQDRGLEDYISA